MGGSPALEPDRPGGDRHAGFPEAPLVVNTPGLAGPHEPLQRSVGVSSPLRGTSVPPPLGATWGCFLLRMFTTSPFSSQISMVVALLLTAATAQQTGSEASLMAKCCSSGAREARAHLTLDHPVSQERSWRHRKSRDLPRITELLAVSVVPKQSLSQA